MKTIEQVYKPYNFSSTRCYVFTLVVSDKGFVKIEHKLPNYIRHLKGIYISSSGISANDGASKIAGHISLNFNGQSLKCFQHSFNHTIYKDDCSHPIEFKELILPNSFVQGYFFDNKLAQLFKRPFKLSIYLHYTL
jgi:hypothetical protein